MLVCMKSQLLVEERKSEILTFPKLPVGFESLDGGGGVLVTDCWCTFISRCLCCTLEWELFSLTCTVVCCMPVKMELRIYICISIYVLCAHTHTPNTHTHTHSHTHTHTHQTRRRTHTLTHTHSRTHTHTHKTLYARFVPRSIVTRQGVNCKRLVCAWHHVSWNAYQMTQIGLKLGGT